MVTISEIEAAMEQLPRLEQESLFACLVRKLGAPVLSIHAMQAQREIWLQQLAPKGQECDPFVGCIGTEE